MAIEIKTSNYKTGLSDWEEFLFGANAPNYIQWRSDDTSPPYTGGIRVGFLEFKGLYANAEGWFTFDLSVLGRYLLGELKNADHLQSIAGPNLYKLEEDLSKRNYSIEVMTFKNPLDGIHETAGVGLTIFSRAYRQSKNRKKQSFFEEAITEYQETNSVESRCLLPTKNITIFKGYPQDVCIFYYKLSNSESPFIADSLVILDDDGVAVSAEVSIPQPLEQGVLRIKLNNLPFFGSPRKIDVCDINFEFDEDGHFVHRRLDVDYRDLCGTYIRWLNSYGGWSYWLFESYPLENVEISRPEKVNVFTPDPSKDETFKTLQKEKQRGFTVSSSNLKNYQIEHLSDLIESRHVYVYNDSKKEETYWNIVTDEFSWSPIEIRSFNKNPNGSAKVRDVSLTYETKEDYTPII